VRADAIEDRRAFGLDRLGHHLQDAMLWWKERTVRPLACVEASEFAAEAQKVAAAARHRGRAVSVMTSAGRRTRQS
jgi:hypothetical protein